MAVAVAQCPSPAAASGLPSCPGSPLNPCSLPANMPQDGSLYGWEAVDERNISEYTATGTLYRHRTGAGGCRGAGSRLQRLRTVHSRFCICSTDA